MNFKGSFVALITPFNSDYSVNYDKLDELIEFHIQNKTDGLVILGTTAEASTLSDREKDEIVRFCVEKVNKRIPIICGSGSNSTQKAIELSVRYEQLGVDALLVITPYYNKTNETGMIKHFKAIASSVKLPIIMYNVPSRTGCSLSVKAIEELAKVSNIKGIKEASGNISFVAKISHLANDEFSILSGNDDQIVPILSLGGVGVISVLANIMPKMVHDMVFSYLEGDILKSRMLQLKYLDVANDIFLETNPIPIKAAMNYLGYNVGPLRLPLDEMGESKEILFKTLDKIKEVL